MVCTVCFSRDGKFLLEAVFWVYTTILEQLDCRLFSLVMENSCSKQLGFLSLSNYSWTLGLQIVWLGTYSMHCEIFCPRQLEFWACPHVFDQLDGFVRHAWFALSVSLVMENSCSRQFFEFIQLFLNNWIADCLVWWWKILARSSWDFWACPTILGHLDCRLFG